MIVVENRKAFTLIELLVVIAIIALLATLLFPVARTAMLRADQTVSLNNLRQWGSAMSNSLADFNGCMPWEGYPIALEKEDAWYNRLPKYMNSLPLSEIVASGTNLSLLQPGKKSVWVNPAVGQEAMKQYGSAGYIFYYGMNYYLSNTQLEDQENGYRNLPLQRVSHPSTVVFMSEKGDDYPLSRPDMILAYYGAAKRDGKGLPTKDPRNAANFLFCDGHVATLDRGVFCDSERAPTCEKDPPDPTFTYLPFEGAKHDL